MSTKVLFFGTHPRQFNGYSKVVYEIAKVLGKNTHDIKLCIYGFQNFYDNPNHRRELPEGVLIYDAFGGETPRGAGFGIEQVSDYVKEYKPDVCVVYNDLLVVTQVLAKIRSSGVPTKIIAYIDQVYLCQKKEFIEQVNKHADFALAFTPYWENIMKEQGVTLPSGFLQHGFNKDVHYPIPKHIARKYFNMNPNDFIILNLNRNQPRKRWDTCLKAFAEVVSRHPNDPIKMVVGTAVTGGWNLLEIYERELKKRNVTLEVGMRHLIFLDNPQKITDEETNILYNVADIGINTCDGEGFGMCNFEQAGLGIPQVVPKIGGFLDFFDDSNAYLVEPTMAYYVDSTRDMVCGEALMCDYMDFAEGIITYYKDTELRHKHGQAARARIVKDYQWPTIAAKLQDVISNLAKPPVKETTDASCLANMVENIDINELNKIIAPKHVDVPEVAKSTSNQDIPVVPKITKKKNQRKGRLTNQKTIKELQQLKRKIDSLLKDTEDGDDEE